MIVRVRMFAALRQHAGCQRAEVELPAQATIGQLRRQLAEQFPPMARLVAVAMFAVNAQYAGDDAPISGNDDVACIPPVSGG